MLTTIYDFLAEHVTGGGSDIIIVSTLLAITATSAVLCYYVTKIILRLLERLVLRSPTEWDDDLVNMRLLKAISQLAPAICVRWMLPGFFSAHPVAFKWLSSITSLYIVVAVVLIITIFIGNFYQALSRRDRTRPYAVKGIFQMLKLIFICLGAIVGLSIIIGRSPVVIFTALGASAAVLMLVFKDTILGLVASIQLTANKMVQRGDWIVDDKHGINGEVLDVSLTTVKVKNWDNSVSTIPPYNLVSESFRNYDPMRVDGARRIERAFYIDINTVRFLAAAEIEELRSEGFLEGIDTEKATQIVNLGLLRRYLENYLATHPMVNKDMIYMVRQMNPTQAGLPLQLYFFTTITQWKEYEGIQSDIFDHVFAVVNRFGLAIFQSPAGTDLSRTH